MTFDYANIRDNVVIPQIANFGTDATLTQPGVPTGDEWDPTPGTPTDYQAKVLEIDFTAADRTGTLVEENDVKFLMSTQGSPEPDLKGELTVGGIKYQVYKLKPKRPGAVILFWYVFCRK